MEQATKEILEKQLKLLSEYSTSRPAPRDLVAITKAMCEVADALREPMSPLV